jgi:hypothetical protein
MLTLMFTALIAVACLLEEETKLFCHVLYYFSGISMVIVYTILVYLFGNLWFLHIYLIELLDNDSDGPKHVQDLLMVPE